VWVVRSHNPMLPRVRLVWEEGWVHFIRTIDWGKARNLAVVAVCLFLTEAVWLTLGIFATEIRLSDYAVEIENLHND